MELNLTVWKANFIGLIVDFTELTDLYCIGWFILIHYDERAIRYGSK